MLKDITLFISGGVVFGVIIFSVFFIFRDKIVNTYLLDNSQKQALQSPQPQITAAQPAPEPSQKVEDIGKKTVENLRSSLYQEGITISAKVDKIYPGKGFIVVDDVGTKLYTKWAGTEPSKGGRISIKGTVQRLANNQDSLKDDLSSTPELEKFLKDQQIFIEAKAVTSSP